MASEPKKTTIINCQPGIQRDGTNLDSMRYSDGQWVRFQRGRPKKMNGCRQITAQLNGPIREVYTWSRQSLNQITAFSGSGIEAIMVDQDGIGSAIYNRTPAGFTTNDNFTWQVDTMYDAAAGSTKTILLAHGTGNLANIDDTTATAVYWGGANETTALQSVGVSVSGGVVCMSPYAVYYGSDGQVTWSNANEPRNVTTGDAGTARPTGSKIVKGLPIRGSGQSPSALLWSLDSLLRMSWIGGSQVFKFDTITAQSSILSSRSVIEYDGTFFWVGVDRFLMYDGRVREIPNTQNVNWFFDNLNFANRQKVFAAKVPRYGEIWWFFPKGPEATECTHAVIFNVREGYWYDVELGRSAGFYSQVFRYPVMADTVETTSAVRVTFSGITGTFAVGETVTGDTSGATGVVCKLVDSTVVYMRDVTGTFRHDPAETVTCSNGATATVAAAPEEIALHGLWLHEVGKDKVAGDTQEAIYSYFETADFGLPTGGTQEQPVGIDRWTRIARIEPDFNCTGMMEMYVSGNEFAQAAPLVTGPYFFDESTLKIDLREQRREIRLKFASNEMGGDYEMGKVIMHLEIGDARS